MHKHTVVGYFDLVSTVLSWPVGAQHEYVGLNQKYVMLRNFIDINNIITLTLRGKSV